ncbi:MAG: efflux RND transporter periplasmic adaptor subunit [Acidobacteriota bacterium]
MKTRFIAVVASVIALAAGCRRAEPPEAPPQTVRAAVVEQMNVETPERYSATIQPAAQVDLAFKSPGLIESVRQVRGADGRLRDIQAGDRVARGTELAVVRRLDYEQRVQQARDQIAQAQAQAAQAEAVLRQAQQDFTRAENLYRTASLTRPDYDQAKARLDAATAQVNAARSAVEGARTAAAQAELSLKDTSLRAPFTGWLTARNVERGSLVGNASVGFSMIDTRVVKAVFAVPDRSLKSLRLGQRLAVTLEALDNAVQGVVTAISPQADPRTHVFSVEVTLPNASGQIRPGMVGSLALGASSSPVPRLVVPLSAVVRDPANPSGFAVFLLSERGGKTYATARPITPGNPVGNSMEITGGVSAGERIVALGGELLRDGQQVRVIP